MDTYSIPLKLPSVKTAGWRSSCPGSKMDPEPIRSAAGLGKNLHGHQIPSDKSRIEQHDWRGNPFQLLNKGPRNDRNTICFFNVQKRKAVVKIRLDVYLISKSLTVKCQHEITGKPASHLPSKVSVEFGGMPGSALLPYAVVGKRGLPTTTSNSV